MMEEGLYIGSSFDLRHYDTSLAVIFGRRNKFRPDGPFLALYNEFGNFLKESARLIVVGYSFRDAHVNLAIRRWVNACPEPEVVIVDPSLPTWEHYDAGKDKYETDHNMTVEHSLLWDLQKAAKNADDFTLSLVESAASDGVGAVFGAGAPLANVSPS